MKRFITYILLPGALLFSGCDKYLDELPDQRTQLNSPTKVSELLVTAYPRGNYFTFAEAMSDNPIDNSWATAVNDPRNFNPFKFQDVQEVNQDSPTYYWNSCYAAIAAANQALEACRNASNPEAYSAQKGEALLARAYAHFMLVTLYSKAYEQNSDNSNPGIPYVTEPETVVIKKYDRKTVAYVYEMIEKDIVEGLPLINESSYTVPAYHFNRKAAHAFASRFYLFKGQPDKVLEHTSQAFPDNTVLDNLRPWIAYRELTADGLRNIFTRATERSNLLLAETVSLHGRNYYAYRYSLSQEQLNKIVAPVGVTLTAFARYSISSTSFFVMKFFEHFVRVNVNATTGTAYNMIPLFTSEEVLFNRIEANIMKEHYAEALADMNAYVRTRVTSYNATTHGLNEAKIKSFYKTDVTKDAFIQAVLDLRRAEFVHEGMRWLDIKRYKIPVTHTTDGQTFVLLPEDPRRELQIPSEATQAGIALNPR